MMRDWFIFPQKQQKNNSNIISRIKSSLTRNKGEEKKVLAETNAGLKEIINARTEENLQLQEKVILLASENADLKRVVNMMHKQVKCGTCDLFKEEMGKHLEQIRKKDYVIDKLMESMRDLKIKIGELQTSIT